MTGESGVKMTGPYDYVEPSYWYLDQTHGGAWGYNTETSPGPAIPSLRQPRQIPLRSRRLAALPPTGTCTTAAAAS